MMIKAIQALGTSIEKELQDSNNAPFSDICLDHLNSFTHQTSLSDFDSEMSEWLLSNKELPTQLNVYNSFGQPPVTLFNNGHFAVDVYFWMHSDTSIHTHSFSGAFKVLYGRSIQEIYDVQEKHSYAHDVMRTEICRTHTSVLKAEDTQKILSGDGLCHRVVHFDAPTVTLLIRTINDVTIPQWHHFENGLSILKRELADSVYKKLFYYQYLLIRDEQSGMSFLNKFLDSLDRSEALNLFEQLTVDSMGLDEYTVNNFYAAVMSKYEEQEWFQIYEQYCITTENYTYPSDDSPLARFMSHTINTKYGEELTQRILKDLK